MTSPVHTGTTSDADRLLSKRTFLQGLAGAASAAIAAPWTLADEQQKPSTSEKKDWIWMRPGRGRTADQWRRIFERLKSVGIDAVLPEVYNGNHAYFDHPHPAIETRATTLEEMIGPAHEVGVEVHAWMWTMPCTNRTIVRNHPDWFVVNGKGESAHEKPAYVGYYKFLCPRKPAVQDFVAGNCEALANIEGLDGVHLDYVRLPDVILAKGLWKKYDIVQDREYPQYDYCYCDDCRRQFNSESGIDPLTDLADPSADDAWRQFRYDGVSNLVNKRLVPPARNAGKQITAAVFPNWQYVRQQWHRWDLDGFLPMLYHSFYNEDVDWIGEETRAAIGRLNGTKPVYAGLFLPSLSPTDLAAALTTAEQSGASGYSLFSHGSLRDAHWQVLAEAMN